MDLLHILCAVYQLLGLVLFNNFTSESAAAIDTFPMCIWI